MIRTMPAFMNGSLERLSGHRNEPARVAAMLADPASRYAVFAGDKLVVHAGPAGSGGVWWHERAELPQPMSGVEPVLLGLDAGGTAHFAVQAFDPELPPGPGQAAVDLRSIALQGLVADQMLGHMAQARALLHWHVRHRFCANCGAATTAGDAGYKRVCGSCKAEHFPRTDPVVIIAVVRGQSMLLGRSARFASTMYSTLAGFVEPGETAEDAARREVEEESGVKVGAVRYVMSQPWPFPANLMIGMVGEALSEAISIDPDELVDARWFSFDDVRANRDGRHPEGLEIPPSISIAHHLIIGVIDGAGS
jgi:NAD+ diphosphatase